jgi:hypothetical protein
MKREGLAPSPHFGERMNWKSLIVLMIAMIVIASANAITRIVDIDGSGQYTSIQAAVNASSPGDVVLVYPGRYFENITVQSNSISIISLEETTGDPAYIDSTIVDGRSPTASFTTIVLWKLPSIPWMDRE